MYKKLLATAILVCSLPVVANAAWLFNTWARTTGGTIDSPNKANQTSVNGSVFKSYTTHAALTATVTAPTGYTIAKITKNGSDILNPVSPYVTTVSGGVEAKTAQSLFATFKADTLSVTAMAGTGGSVTRSSSGTVLYGQQASPIVFKFTPKTGYKVATIAVVGVAPADYTVTMLDTPANNYAVIPAVVPTPFATPVTVTIKASTVLTLPVTVGGTFSSSAEIAGVSAPTTVLIGATPVILTGTKINGVSTFSKWSSVSRPAGVAPIATVYTATTSFIPAVDGTYAFLYRIADTAQGAARATVKVVKTLADSANQCANCHNNNGIGAGYAAAWAVSAHAQPGGPNLCSGCHVGADSGAHPGTTLSACNTCHAVQTPYTAEACGSCHVAGPHATGYVGQTCSACHGTIHYVTTVLPAKAGCIDCHTIGAPLHAGSVAGSTGVNDNAGVRAIVPEFAKRSHHITGAAPTNAQCVVCHLEGKVSGAVVVIDTTKHMVDAKIHLRNADDSTDMQWSGTEHTVMDNFCFSCHDTNGAATVPVTFTGVTGFTGTASNPFGDTLTNSYDQVARAGVVDVKTAFTTTNASHHAVSGQRYKYRFSTVANAQAWAARTGNPMPAASEIAVGHTDLDGAAIEFEEGVDSYEPHGAEEGGHATLYEGDKFVSTYIPLGASLNVADNSTLHCGDCHTVGQWKAGSSTNADGSATTAAIGAHGSNNEYLLRNSLGTDAIHNQLTYVCFNCHKAGQNVANAATWAEQVAEGLIADSVAPTAGSALNPLGAYIPLAVPTVAKAGWGALHPTVFAGQQTGYWTAHAVSAMHAQCQADSADNIASGNTGVAGRGLKFANMSGNRLVVSWSPLLVKTLDYFNAAGVPTTPPVAGGNSTSGNLTGIACTNCHNSGLRNGWGGIHGGDNTYTDGLGRTQKSYRFMPGMGNYRYAPPGGWDGKDVSDPSLLTVNNPIYPGTPGSRTDQAVGFPGASGKPMGGCYTNGASVSAGGNGDLNISGGQSYGTCNHHGTSTVASVGDLAQRVGKSANFRATYGGGTTSTPTAFEPTVREATAGGTLVTRPLKY